MPDDAQQLQGSVSQVIFRNEENGYTVLRLSAEGHEEEVTAVGCMPGVSPGERLTVTGTWSCHPTYGSQFKVKTMERQLPTAAAAIVEYLASGAIKGVGAITARRLVDEFGDDTFDIIEHHPLKMTSIPGISPKRARDISKTFLEIMGMRRLLDFLRGHDLSADLAIPLYRMYGPQALEQVRTNPYLLAGEDFGVPFLRADALAVSMGVDGLDPQRLEAALLFELRHNAGNGHTFLPADKLLHATARLLSLEGPEALEGSLDDLTRRRVLVRETVAGVDCVYLWDLHESEVYVATRLEEMAQAELAPPAHFDRVLASIQAEQGITYAPQQVKAVELAARRQVMLLTGGPGTGKTTSLRGVLALFDAMGLTTQLAAPTGRAAKRMGELCGQEAYTIHRLLETHFDDATGRVTFTHNQDKPLKADAVIVDETSMVDISLMSALLAALKGDCRLVLVGDPNQLPSVGPGALLADVLKSGLLPAVSLEQVFRQAAKSAIVRVAHEIHHGVVPQLHWQEGDFYFLKRLQPEKAVDTIVELVGGRLPKYMGLPPSQIQVLCPTRKYPTGAANLNLALQQAVNPPSPDKKERPFGSVTFREGDRVMQVKNNYDVMWTEPATHTSGLGIFNGDIGQITSIEEDGSSLVVDFEGKQVLYTPDALNELELAYAVTVHKAQGSEYPAVVLACLEAAPMLLTRSVLYTAVTRAKTLFVGVGDERIFARMVENDRPQKRYTALRARLQGE